MKYEEYIKKIKKMGITSIAIFELYIKSKIAVFVNSEFHENDSCGIGIRVMRIL